MDKVQQKFEGYYHPSVIARREQIQNEINKQKLVIDYGAFRKTPEEKAKLKVLMMEWKLKEKKYTELFK
jgi:hypothetical protein